MVGIRHQFVKVEAGFGDQVEIANQSLQAIVWWEKKNEKKKVCHKKERRKEEKEMKIGYV